MNHALLLTSLAAMHLALTALPGVAAVSSAARAGLRDVPVLLAVGMVGSGVAALLAFWAYFAAPPIGHACAIAVVAISFLFSFRHRRAFDPHLRRHLLVPAALWCFGTLFLIFLGFLYGGTDQPMLTGMTRFSHQLPSDNYLPLFFADALFARGHNGPPAHFVDWLSSDRPPLQSGFVLGQRIFAWTDPALHYQVLSVALQQLWIVGLWSVLLAIRVRAFTRGLIVITLLLSDVVIVNGFFVWPKLLSAAYLLAAAAFILSERWRADRRDLRSAALVAALFALALLSHGGSVFGIVPLVAIAAIRGVPTARWVAVGLVSGLALLVPWFLYQRYEDPPGNRLIKWMFAGVHAVDDRSSLEALNDAYAAVGISGAVQNKLGNFRTMVGGEQVFARMRDTLEFGVSARPAQAIRQVRVDRFFGFLQSLGIFALAPVVMLVSRARGRRLQEDGTFAIRSFGCAILGCLVWGILMFGDPNTRTVMHAGSFALPLLALAGCVAGLAAVSRRMAALVVVFHCLMALAIYLPVLDPVPGGQFSPATATAALLALVGFFMQAFWPFAVNRTSGRGFAQNQDGLESVPKEQFELEANQAMEGGNELE